jgi:hypothetical protein
MYLPNSRILYYLKEPFQISVLLYLPFLLYLLEVILYKPVRKGVLFHCFTEGDVIIIGEGLQNLCLCSALRAYEQ